MSEQFDDAMHDRIAVCLNACNEAGLENPTVDIPAMHRRIRELEAEVASQNHMNLEHEQMRRDRDTAVRRVRELEAQLAEKGRQMILAEDAAERLQQWRDEVIVALGSKGLLSCDVITELERLRARCDTATSLPDAKVSPISTNLIKKRGFFLFGSKKVTLPKELRKKIGHLEAYGYKAGMHIPNSVFYQSFCVKCKTPLRLTLKQIKIAHICRKCKENLNNSNANISTENYEPNNTNKGVIISLIGPCKCKTAH